MNVNITSMSATWMQTALTRTVLTNAHVKRDTPAMDIHVQVHLIFIIQDYNKCVFHYLF